MSNRVFITLKLVATVAPALAKLKEIGPGNVATLACLSQGRQLTRQQFEDACELRFREREGVSLQSASFFAKECVSEFLAGQGIAFGAPGYDWTAKGARDLADAEMAHWEREP